MALRGTAAIANARLAYRLWEETQATERFAALAAAGARTQRPLWASTSTKDPAYRDTRYVEELVATDTVNTMPGATLTATADHGAHPPRRDPRLPGRRARHGGARGGRRGPRRP